MSFSGDSLQQKLVKLIAKYKKTFGFILLAIFALFIGNSIRSISEKKQIESINTVLIECQNLEKEKKYNESFQKISNIYTKHKDQINNNPNLKYMLDLYKYKIGSQIGLEKEVEKDIINTNYISQWWHYDNYSTAGEIILLKKMIILYNHQTYDLCENIFLKNKMQKIPHFGAITYRYAALKKLNKENEARSFLVQVFLYYSRFDEISKELIKKLIFLDF